MATYSRNTTTKVAAMPRGTYTFPVNTNSDFLICPANTRYKIWSIMIDAAMGDNTLRLRDAAGVYFPIGLFSTITANQNVDVTAGTTNPRATIVKATASSATQIYFNPPLELSEGQGLNWSNSSGGSTSGARNWSAFGEALVNTP